MPIHCTTVAPSPTSAFHCSFHRHTSAIVSTPSVCVGPLTKRDVQPPHAHSTRVQLIVSFIVRSPNVDFFVSLSVSALSGVLSSSSCLVVSSVFTVDQPVNHVNSSNRRPLFSRFRSHTLHFVHCMFCVRRTGAAHNIEYIVRQLTPVSSVSPHQVTSREAPIVRRAAHECLPSRAIIVVDVVPAVCPVSCSPRAR